MFSCSSTQRVGADGKMSLSARKCIDRFCIQSKFRELHPDKAKAIQGMTVPDLYADSIEGMLEFANEKIKNQKVKADQEKKLRESIGAPVKFDKYGKYKY